MTLQNVSFLCTGQVSIKWDVFSCLLKLTLNNCIEAWRGCRCRCIATHWSETFPAFIGIAPGDKQTEHVEI